MKVKKTQITVETYEVFAIKQSSRSQSQIQCSICNVTVQGLKPEEAATVTGTSVRAIYRWIEAGTLHFTESADGLLLICHNSLTQNDKVNPESDRNFIEKLLGKETLK